MSSILDPVSIVADYNMNPLVETCKGRNLARALDIVKTKATLVLFISIIMIIIVISSSVIVIVKINCQLVN